MTDHNRNYEQKHEASQRAAANLLQKLGTKLEKLDRWVQETPDDSTYITEVRFKVRYETVGDILAVIKARTPEGKQIAFHSDDTIAECLAGLVNRLDNGTLKWKEDTPYAERSDN